MNWCDKIDFLQKQGIMYKEVNAIANRNIRNQGISRR